MMKANIVRVTKILVLSTAGVAVVAWAAQNGMADSQLARWTAKAKESGLPTTDAEMEAIAGPMPSADEQKAFQDLDEIRVWSGLAELDENEVERPSPEKRVAIGESFLKAAEEASHIKFYRFTKNWKSFPAENRKDVDGARRAASLFCTRAILSARDNKRDKCLHDLETSARLTEILGRDASYEGMQSLSMGRRRLLETLCNSLGFGEWNKDELARANRLFAFIDHDIDPRRFIAGQFATHWWMCDNPDRVFASLKAAGNPVDPADWMSVRAPGASARLKAKMIEATVATQKLFADPSLSVAERLVKADEFEFDPVTDNLNSEIYSWFVSPRPIQSAREAVSDKARRVTTAAILEALELRAGGAKDWTPKNCTDPFTDKPVKFEMKEKGFVVSCEPGELNDRLRSSEAKVQRVTAHWPFFFAIEPRRVFSPGGTRATKD